MYCTPVKILAAFSLLWGVAASAPEALPPKSPRPPAESAPPKTDPETLTFLISQIRADESFGFRWAVQEDYQRAARLDNAIFQKYFADYELWLVSDSSLIGGGRNQRWLLARERGKPRAFLIGEVGGRPFAKNMAALFSAARVSPEDEAQALALAKLAISLTRHSAGRVLFRDEITDEQFKALDAELSAKFGEPVVKKKGTYAVSVPVYQETDQIFSRQLALVVYEFEFGEQGEMSFTTTVQANKTLRTRP